VPSDPTTNNISVLVEAAALKGVYSVEEFQEKKTREKEARRAQEISEDLCQEETMGDFYFETRNYPAALAQYRQAAKRYPQSHRIRRKVQASEYNIGVQHIKSREYGKALKCMEQILKADPENRHAKKKALQLRRILHRDRRKREKRLSGEGSPAPPS
jgi:tetratricopeptide (TPR) repeat protein